MSKFAKATQLVTFTTGIQTQIYLALNICSFQNTSLSPVLKDIKAYDNPKRYSFIHIACRSQEDQSEDYWNNAGERDGYWRWEMLKFWTYFVQRGFGKTLDIEWNKHVESRMTPKFFTLVTKRMICINWAGRDCRSRLGGISDQVSNRLRYLLNSKSSSRCQASIWI